MARLAVRSGVTAGAVLALVCGWALKSQAADGDAEVSAAVERVHGVLVSDGDRVVLSIDAKGAPVVVSREKPASIDLPRPVNDTKVESTFKFTARPVTAAADTLVATFQSFGEPGAELKMENGFSHPVIYDAAIVMRTDRGLTVTPTTICPIAARNVAVESWGGPVTGVIISNPHKPPGDDMHCQGDTGLVTGPRPAQPSVCTGGSLESPIEVQMLVDPATGARLEAAAAWVLHDPSGGKLAPFVALRFPMQADKVAGRPVGATVFAIVPADPAPTSRSASIVLLADGVEAARRPWKLYAQRMAELSHPPDGDRPVAFVGAIPFPLRAGDGSPDPQLEALFARIGDGQVGWLEVRIEGDDGVVLGHSGFNLANPAVRDGGLVTAALRDAEAKSAAPGHCAVPAQAPKG